MIKNLTVMPTPFPHIFFMQEESLFSVICLVSTQTIIFGSLILLSEFNSAEQNFYTLEVITDHAYYISHYN